MRIAASGQVSIKVPAVGGCGLRLGETAVQAREKNKAEQQERAVVWVARNE